MESIKIQVKVRKIFFNQWTQKPYFTIAYVLVQGNSNLGRFIKVKGNYRLNPGQEYQLLGQLVDSKYGATFQITHCTTLQPQSDIGWINFFMQHPKIRLNRKQAKALIAYYGTEKTFSRILHEADHLKKMSVFSSDDYENITTLAKEMVELSELHSTLVAHGLELGIIEQLKKIKLSSHRIRHLIQTQTYALIGMLFLPFQQADRIFKIFNPEPEPALAQYRAVFLVTYHLNQLCNKQGDTYISYNALWKAVAKSSDQLGINAFDQAVTAAENKKLIKSVLDINNKRLLFPFYLYQSEQKIMSFLTQKIPVWQQNNHLLDKVQINDIKSSYHSHLDFSLEQKNTIAYSINHPLALINGGPGTGKTTIVKEIIRFLKSYFEDKVKITLLAPTGKAALVLQKATNNTTKTIHRLIEWPGGSYQLRLMYSYQSILAKNYRSVEAIKIGTDELGVLIIDEMSMVSTWLLAEVLQVTADYQKVILIGDSCQLPSIEPGAVFADLVTVRPPFLNNLTKVYRHNDQTGGDILHLLTIFRQKDISALQKYLHNPVSLRDVVLLDIHHPADILVQILRLYRDWEKQKLDLYHDVQIIIPQYQKSIGIIAVNQFLQTQFNAQPYASPKYHLFKLKDKVMQTTNREEVKNGEIGVVMGIDPQANNDHFLKVKFGDREINYHRHQVQQQLILAYACSVHKVQGNEFVEVAFVIHREHQFSLKNSWVYTALSRARTKLYILGEINLLTYACEHDSPPRATGLQSLAQVAHWS